MISGITLADLRSAWLKRAGVKAIRRKSDSWTQRAIGWFLRVAGINAEYMDRYWSTLGRVIYLPDAAYERVSSGALSVEDLRLLCHEARHVQQYRQDGPVRFVWRYLLRQRYRADYEAEAYAVHAQVRYQFGQDVSDEVGTYIDQMQRAYGVDRVTARAAAGELATAILFMRKIGKLYDSSLYWALKSTREGVPSIRAEGA